MIRILIPLIFLLKANVLVIGDSITAAEGNYVDVLRSVTPHYYTKSGHVGKSSTYIKDLILKMRLKDYSTIIVECGINNVDQPDIVISDLQAISHFAKRENPNMKVICLTLPPYKGYSTWTIKKQKSLERINAWILSNKEFVGVDIYTSLSKKGYSKHSADKLHPNKKGHQLMALEILKFL
jgi:lysophospholipase L1-like esterase